MGADCIIFGLPSRSMNHIMFNFSEAHLKSRSGFRRYKRKIFHQAESVILINMSKCSRDSYLEVLFSS